MINNNEIEYSLPGSSKETTANKKENSNLNNRPHNAPLPYCK